MIDQTHAVMFHHFHSENHLLGQGSISAQQFVDILDWLCDKYSLLDAEEYSHKLLNNRLERNDICLTFDDALLCQADIAAPILKARNIRAFFFIYSSPFRGDPDFLEIYRYFRTSQFPSVESFYENFFEEVQSLLQTKYSEAESAYDKDEYLKAYAFYTPQDRWFRYLRDNILDREKYQDVMGSLMTRHGFDHTQVMHKLWMSDKHLETLKSDGHTIGLHSYSHPTTMHILRKEEQQKEYRQNSLHLGELIGEAPAVMSHPCGAYNNETLQILNDMEVRIGFRSNLAIPHINSNLEIPREDHANVLVKMAQ